MSIGQELPQETPKTVEDSPFPHCPHCGAPLEFCHDYVIQNYMLYEASGGYDGGYEYEWWECPGCDYQE